MFNHIMSILSNGGFWTVILVILSNLPKVNKVIEAHLETKKATKRNAHELSLMRAADRIIPSVMKVATATPKDRLDEAVSELCAYANARGIHINEVLAKHFINKAFSKYKANGGNIVKTVKATVPGI